MKNSDITCNSGIHLFVIVTLMKLETCMANTCKCMLYQTQTYILNILFAYKQDYLVELPDQKEKSVKLIKDIAARMLLSTRSIHHNPIENYGTVYKQNKIHVDIGR